TVIFDDTAAGTTTVSLTSGTVNPGSVTFKNNTASYTLSGASGIVGQAALAMTGSGAVTISTSNSYSGGTTISSGSLTATGSQALGTGSITQSGGTLSLAAPESVSSVSLSAGRLNIGHPQALGNGTLTIGGGTIDNSSGSSLALATNNPLNLNNNFTF